MRRLHFSVCIALISFSCGQSDNKEKNPPAKDSTKVIPVDKTTQQSDVLKDTARTVKLTFTGYEEGDYAHLLFSETGADHQYDFGHPEDNNLNNIPVVIKNSNTAFGYKENSKMKGAKFIVDIVYKTTDTYDGNGQPTIGKEWRIANLRKDE